MTAFQNAAWCRLLQGQAHTAKPYMEKVEGFLERSSSPAVEAEHLCQIGLYHRLLDDLERSTRACQEVFERFSRSAELASYVGQAAWLVAENALDAGRVAEARIFAILAMEYAEKCQWPDLVNLVSRLYYRLQQAEQAEAS